jgi:phosphate transport system substrate-binding protein
MSKFKIFILFFIITITNVGCNFFPKEATTYGKNRIGVDETLQPALKPAFYMFKTTYQKADLQVDYLPEVNIIREMYRDSIELLVLSRKLNDEENALMKERQITPRYTPIARDGLVILLNKSNPDKLLSYEQILDIFSGKITNWSQVSKKNGNGKIQLIFDNDNSSTATYFLDQLNMKTLPEGAAAAKGVEDIIDKVSKVKGGIGVVGLAWVGNLNEAEDNKVKNLVNIAYVRPKGSTKDEYFTPDQMNISDSLYPLSRTIYVVDCSGRSSLGTGFASFMFTEQGQRIILKTGILPYFVPARTINLK